MWLLIPVIDTAISTHICESPAWQAVDSLISSPPVTAADSSIKCGPGRMFLEAQEYHELCAESREIHQTWLTLRRLFFCCENACRRFFDISVRVTFVRVYLFLRRFQRVSCRLGHMDDASMLKVVAFVNKLTGEVRDELDGLT